MTKKLINWLTDTSVLFVWIKKATYLSNLIHFFIQARSLTQREVDKATKMGQSYFGSRIWHPQLFNYSKKEGRKMLKLKGFFYLWMCQICPFNSWFFFGLTLFYRTLFKKRNVLSFYLPKSYFRILIPI